MAALAISRIVMFAVRVLPPPVHRLLDTWSAREAARRRARRLARK